MKKLSIFLILFLVAATSSCTVINEFGYQVNRILKKNQTEKNIAGRHGVNKKKRIGNEINAELLNVSSWAVYPDRATTGDTITSKIVLEAYDPDMDSQVNLEVSRALVIGKETIKFGRPKIEQRSDGKITLSWNFTLPIDADSGEYILVTDLSNGELSEQVKSKFLVN